MNEQRRPSRRRTPRVFRAAVIAALVLAISAGLAETASAEQEPVWHWNIFGTCGTVAGRQGNCGGTRNISPQSQPTDVIVASVAGAGASKPWVITLNEVCGRQFSDLFLRLAPAPYGYILRFAKSNGWAGVPSGSQFDHVNCGEGTGGLGGEFGNAVLMLGWDQSYPSDYYYPGQAPDVDQRVFSCLRVATFFGYRRGCVTHLNPGEGQETYAKNAFDLHILTGDKVILGADRNTTNWGVFGSFPEVDTASPKLRTFYNGNPDKKYDWVFGGPGHGTVAGTWRYCSPNSVTPTSDHCMLLGRFNI